MFKVLVVDDNIDDLNGIIHFVSWKSLDCTVVATANNGLMGIEMAKQHSPDIIITDISMPSVSGLEMTKQILEFLPSARFIYISCFNDFEFAQQAISMGVSYYILKPIDIDELAESIIKVKAQKEEEIKKLLLEYSLKKQISENKSILTESFFINLILKNFNEREEIFRQANFLGIDTNSPYQVVVLQIDSDYSDEIDNIYMYNCHLKNMLNEYILSKYNGYCVNYGLSSIILILRDNMATDDVLINELDAMQQDILQSINITITIYLGLKVTIYEIANEFKQIMNTMKNECFNKNGQILTAGDIYLCNETIDLDSFTDIYSDIEFIFLSNNNSCIDEFIKKYYPDDKKYGEIPTKVLSFYIINTINLQLSERGEDFGQVFDNDFSVWEKLINYKTILNIRQWIKNILTLTKDYLINKEASQAEKLSTEIKAIIDKNYADLQTLEQIVSPLYISVSNARRVFKMYTGETIFDYLLKTRMEQAKKLMHNKELKIYEIGRMVGYMNTTYFTTSFRLYTGYSPKEYRIIFC